MHASETHFQRGMLTTERPAKQKHCFLRFGVRFPFSHQKASNNHRSSGRLVSFCGALSTSVSDTLSCPRDPEMSASPSGTLVLRRSQTSETRRSKGQGLGIQLQKLRPVWWRFPAQRQEPSLSGAAIASRSPRTSRSTSRRCGRRPGEILPVAALATGCQGLDLWSFWLRSFWSNLCKGHRR